MIDIRARLLEAFAAERAEHLAAIRAALAARAGGEAIDLRDVFRRMHSLKGAARAVELPAVEAVAHDMETLLAAVQAGEVALDEAAVARLHRALDAIEDGRGVEEAMPAAAADPQAAAGQRVAGSYLDALGRSLAGLLGEVQSRSAAAELLPAVAAGLRSVRERLGAVAGGELVAELARLERGLAEARRRITREEAGTARAIAAVERDVEQLMLVPAGESFAGLDRMVREIAEAAGKQVAFVIEGGAVEADRRVIEALRDPVRHLLRNAVAHGIEAPERRVALGKPAEGRVTLSIRVRAGDLELTVADDGAGPDLGSIAARRAAQGVRGEAPAALLAHLFDQGFSTSAGVDAISGRGVGLAAVAATARRLQGDVAMRMPEGGGAAVTVTVPLGLARQMVILVEAGGERLAVPSRGVTRVLALDPAAIRRVEGRDLAAVDGHDAPLPVLPLSRLLGFGDPSPDPGGDLRALMLDGEEPVVVTVDALEDARSMLVNDAAGVAMPSPLVGGTILLEGGRAAIVLSPDAVHAAARAAVRGGAAGPSLTRTSGTAEAARRPTILVVDDSITTRTLERSILEAQGYQVRIAVDGLAGLELLRAEPGLIDLVVADVEMPRMDGFGLLTSVRNDPALAGIPVIMMTSRNSADDIRRGLDLGASAYVTKQEFDQGRLLETVARLL